MPDPKTVHARQRGDGVGILDALRGFDLAEQRAASVCRSELVFDGPRPVAVMRDLEGDAAAPLGRVLHGIDDVTRLGRRADHRKHEAFRAHVHRSRDVVIVLRRRSNDDGKVGRLENIVSRSSPSRSRSLNARDRRAQSRIPRI